MANFCPPFAEGVIGERGDTGVNWAQMKLVPKTLVAEKGGEVEQKILGTAKKWLMTS